MVTHCGLVAVVPFVDGGNFRANMVASLAACTHRAMRAAPLADVRITRGRTAAAKMEFGVLVVLGLATKRAFFELSVHGQLPADYLIISLPQGRA